jgi:DNA-binding GntR family transcriptional regulator
MSRRPKSASAPEPSIRDRAYRYIQKIIAEGTMEAGSAVSELVLAKELGSSRTPIREAMSQLAAEGLLEPNANGGMVVARLKREDIIELYELREALEVYAVGRVASIPLRPADKDRLQYTVDAIQKLEQELGEIGASELNDEQMRRFIACDLGFHSLLMSMTQNSRIQKLIHETRLLIRIFAIQRQGHDKSQLESIRLYHQRILDAVGAHDPDLAMKELSAHIQVSQRERLNEFDHWRRESALRQSVPSIFAIEKIAPEL